MCDYWFYAYAINSIGVARGPRRPTPTPTPNRNATNDNNVAKKAFFLQFKFLLASSRTTVINNNIDN